MKNLLFHLLCGAAIVVALSQEIAFSQGNRLTARQVIERIQKNVGVPWMAQTVDTFKAGDPETPITGVATTMMATYDVLERAGAAGKNLVITHEPTFYDHNDKVEDLEKANDTVYKAKADLIKKYNLVVWRFHDHWHMRRPDGVMTGMIAALGWEKYKKTEERGPLFVIPETTLGELASQIKAQLKIKTMRVIGDPNLKLSKLALTPGYSGFPRHRQLLQRDDVDAVVIGEAREWESIEYADDAVAEGKKKAMIILGHIPSEQAGMEECARWIKTFVSEVPVELVPAKEPFWAPK